MSARVVHVITGLGRGGSEGVLVRLLARADRDRFEPHVVSLLDEGVNAAALRKGGVPVHVARPAPSAGLLPSLFELVRLIRGLSPSLLQGWMYHGNLAATLAGWLPGCRAPVLWNVRNSLHTLASEKRATALAIRCGSWLSGQPKAIVYCSRASAAQHEALGYRAASTRLIPNGFDCERFRPDPEARRRMRAELGVPEEAVLVGHAARWHPMKDHLGFVKAAGLAARESGSLVFVAVGTGIDAGNEALAAELRESGLEGRMRLLGEREDMPAVLAALDLFCSSSASEAFPNAVGEAMACGVPCVVTDVGDSRWLAGDTGWVAPPGRPEQLARALLEAASVAREARRGLGERARRRVVDELSLEAMVGRYESLWDEALAGGKRSA